MINITKRVRTQHTKSRHCLTKSMPHTKPNFFQRNYLTLSDPWVFFGHMKSGLVKEDEVDFTAQNVALSSIKHDLRSPTLKWAAQPLFGKVRSAPWSQPWLHHGLLLLESSFLLLLRSPWLHQLDSCYLSYVPWESNFLGKRFTPCYCTILEEITTATQHSPIFNEICTADPPKQGKLLRSLFAHE